MTNPPKSSVLASLAVAAFGALSLLGGWLVVFVGGFYHSPGKNSANAVFYDGGLAWVMALLQFSASALAFAHILSQRFTTARSVTVAFGTVFVPPLLYLLFR